MRDAILFVVVFGALPFVLYRPYIGVLLWAWIGYMNPHRLTWGAAYDFPFAQVIAIVTLFALLITRQRKWFEWNRLTITWLLFVAWMALSTYLAQVPEEAVWEWERTAKIQLISFVTLLLIYEKDTLVKLIWVIVLSLGFYGVKGGLFSLLTGGGFRVYGPSASFIDDNNTLAMALIMVIPLMFFLASQVTTRAAKIATYVLIALTVISVFASQSRGAFLGGGTMILFLFLKSRGKAKLLIPMGILLIGTWIFMPESWHERMGTIATYSEDASAMGRINAWMFAVNLALDHPFVGGGFNTFTPELFQEYAPNPDAFHDSHSIYFEVLAEHGFVGLLLFAAMWIFTYRMGDSIAERSTSRPDLAWTADLAAMLQVSLVGYAATGAFLGLAYFDLYYHLLAFMLITNSLSTAAPDRKQTAITAEPDDDVHEQKVQ